MADPFLGEIRLLPYSFGTPRSWALCNGALLPIKSNTALFTLLGAFYGGNGSTTFALPNLIGNIPIGTGQGAGLPSYNLGEITGTTSVTLSPQQSASHTHGLVAATNQATTATAGGNNLAAGIGGSGREAPQVLMYSSGGPDTQLSNQSIVSVGGNGAHDNTMPYLAMAYYICINGIFPSRP